MFGEGGNKPTSGYLGLTFEDPQRGLSFLEMAQDKDTHFLSWQDYTWQDKPAKELRVRYSAKGWNSNETVHREVSYFFSPEEAWVCRGQRWWNQKKPKEFELEHVYSYENMEGIDFPVLKRIDAWVPDEKSPDNRRHRNWTEILEFRLASPFPDSDFRLSAFGLPEPQGVVWSKPARTWIWLLVGAAAAGIFAVAFARARSRLLKRAKP
jgi:hypothetical protein